MNRIPPKPQVLLVDDDFDLANLLQTLLLDCDYAVDIAYDGVQALGKIKAKHYDVVLCDYQMPRMNGQVLFETLQQSHPEVTSRFIFVTGNARMPEVAAFFRAVSVPFLEKPFRSAEVLQLVGKIVQASKN